MSIIAKLTEKKDFSASESKIADYIIENKEEIFLLWKKLQVLKKIQSIEQNCY